MIWLIYIVLRVMVWLLMFGAAVVVLVVAAVFRLTWPLFRWIPGAIREAARKDRAVVRWQQEAEMEGLREQPLVRSAHDTSAAAAWKRPDRGYPDV